MPKRIQLKRTKGWRMPAGAVKIDHVRPSALGGASTIENVRVCCRAHNQRRAREVFGDAWMDRFTGRGVPQARSTP